MDREIDFDSCREEGELSESEIGLDRERSAFILEKKSGMYPVEKDSSGMDCN